MISQEEKNLFYNANIKSINDNSYLDLWVQVIIQAIDDYVLYSILEEEYNLEGREIKEEQIIYKQSAYDFLFNKDHTIFIDDYQIVYKCFDCLKEEKSLMSKFANGFICSCGKNINSENTDYITIEETAKTTTLHDLLAYFNFDSIKFRKKMRIRIEELKELKRKKRARQKLQRQNKKSK